MPDEDRDGSKHRVVAHRCGARCSRQRALHQPECGDVDNDVHRIDQEASGQAETAQSSHHRNIRQNDQELNDLAGGNLASELPKDAQFLPEATFVFSDRRLSQRILPFRLLFC